MSLLFIYTNVSLYVFGDFDEDLFQILGLLNWKYYLISNKSDFSGIFLKFQFLIRFWSWSSGKLMCLLKLSSLLPFLVKFQRFMLKVRIYKYETFIFIFLNLYKAIEAQLFLNLNSFFSNSSQLSSQSTATWMYPQKYLSQKNLHQNTQKQSFFGGLKIH